MKKNWTCSKCFLVFSRKWNLERHNKLIHEYSEQLDNFESSLKNKLNGSTLPSNGSSNTPRGRGNFQDLYDVTELMDKMANSNQMFGRVNSLQGQVASLQQQLRYFQTQLNDVTSYNWLVSKESIQGFSGYTCMRCKSFSLKPIFDVGYDMTMQSRHQCYELVSKRNYINFELPSHEQNTDDWTAQILFSYINYTSPFGKFLHSKDLTSGFNNFKKIMGIDEVRQVVFGIPERYYSHSIDSNSQISWIHRVINNIEKKIPITDAEALDFLKRVKSTYAIFEIPVGNSVKEIYIGFTNC